MKIKSVQIQNFRSIQNQNIEFANQTILIGANGAGKSTVLKALQAFFEINFRPKTEDFFGHNTKDPIEISVTFHHFTPDETEIFKSRIHNSEMSVTRAFGGEAMEAGTYHGLVKGAVEFTKFKEAKTAAEKKEEYIKLFEAGTHGLPKYSNKETAEKDLSDWEVANPTLCRVTKDDGQFLGFKNVGAGKLQNATNFILIEAVRDASQDASDQKNSAVGQLMDLIVRSAMQQNSKILSYQEEVNQKYNELTKPQNFPELDTLQTALTKSLQTYYEDVGVKLKWQDPEGVTLPPPKAAIKFSEEKFEYPVERAGNGVQRAFIISLLHQLLVAKTNNIQNSNDNLAKDTSDNESLIENSQVPNEVLQKLPSIILAIEEPELYQHPTKQWHFAQVLRKLSSGFLKNIFGDVQVVICTHSPNFVSLSEFDNTRIAIKTTADEGDVKHTKIKSASLLDVKSMLEATWEAPSGSYSEESTRSRLHIFGTELSEGFFADGVVLVEGASDKAALEVIADLIGKNFAEKNIAILSVEGKPNIDRPWLIFKQLGIPVYVVWDADSACQASDRAQHIKNNRAIQRMLSIDQAEIQDFPSGVRPSFACFLNDLNAQLLVDNDESFKAAFKKVQEEAGFTSKQGHKNPYLIAEAIRLLYKGGHKIEILENIVTAAFEHIKPAKKDIVLNPKNEEVAA